MPKSQLQNIVFMVVRLENIFQQKEALQSLKDNYNKSIIKLEITHSSTELKPINKIDIENYLNNNHHYIVLMGNEG